MERDASGKATENIISVTQKTVEFENIAKKDIEDVTPKEETRKMLYI
jgi:hypothetical protein